LFRGEKTAFVKMGEQRKDEMSIQVGNNRPCEVVFSHCSFASLLARREYSLSRARQTHDSRTRTTRTQDIE
jgi:hypothetical protein